MGTSRSNPGNAPRCLYQIFAQFVRMILEHLVALVEPADSQSEERPTGRAGPIPPCGDPRLCLGCLQHDPLRRHLGRLRRPGDRLPRRLRGQSHDRLGRPADLPVDPPAQGRGRPEPSACAGSLGPASVGAAQRAVCGPSRPPRAPPSRHRRIASASAHSSPPGRGPSPGRSRLQTPCPPPSRPFPPAQGSRSDSAS